MTWRRIAALAALLLAMSGGARASGDPGDARPGPVDIGGGRTLFLNCQGVGGPTVFIIPGLGSYAEVWNYVVPPDDPIRSSPFDVIDRAQLVPSAAATQPLVARTTRVCAYDRPGTRPDGTYRSTAVPQPHTVQQDVDDVVALIAAAELSAPLVFVAHSYGGLVVDLLARQHPELVAGLVLVDPTSEFLPAVGSPAQNAAFSADVRDRGPGGEGILLEQSLAQIAAAPPLPRVPAAVLIADRFPPPDQLTADNYNQAQIRTANEMLAGALGTTAEVVPGSGHNVMLYQPAAVADVILRVVGSAR